MNPITRRIPMHVFSVEGTMPNDAAELFRMAANYIDKHKIEVVDLGFHVQTELQETILTVYGFEYE